MKSLWDDIEANKCHDDPLQLRVYTSRLLGQEPDLVLHGGGNTSVKTEVDNLFGDVEEILYVKGSGWDLASIESAGFAPVRLHILERMAQLDQLSDSEMVAAQRSAMIDPNAPTPSVEAILHAILPFRYVDHTHADAVVAITNSDRGEDRILQIYGRRVLIVPYVMPGFALAKQVFDLTQDTNWSGLEGIILMNHGVFTFGDTARESYERMIRLVSDAQAYLKRKEATVTAGGSPRQEIDYDTIARIRKVVSTAAKAPMLAVVNTDNLSAGFAKRPDAAEIATRGPLTPDHVIRTKRIPVVLENDVEDDIDRFVAEYHAYFDRHNDSQLKSLDPAPRWALWSGRGTISFGRNVGDAHITRDIVKHTLSAIQWAQNLGGWQALGEKELFDMEYWDLEQAKLRKKGNKPLLQGKVALVTGAASGIGHACVQSLLAQGAAVAALDINKEIDQTNSQPAMLNLVCDITDHQSIERAVQMTVRSFGGVDILVSNAGIFPAGDSIAELDEDTWHRSLNVNLLGHHAVLKSCIPFLKLGIDPAVIVIGSKNVPAPGRDAAAYSVAKAGLTQLARVAALELGELGIRVNVVHPNGVFNTGIWSPEVVEARAQRYGLSIEAYRKNNVLGVEVTSKDVAELTAAMAGPLFAKTTGAQIPIDGGNDRVI